MKKRLIEDISRINQLLGLNEMIYDGKSTGLFSDEETTMNQLEYDPTKVVHNDEDHIVVDRDMEDKEFTYDKDDVSYMDDEWLVIDKDEEEESPTVRRSDRDRARRRPYSPKARFRGGLSEQERPPLALDRDLSFVLDEIHDDLFYTLPGQFQEYNLGEQVRLYQELKSRLDSYPASKSLPEVKQILDRMEYDLSGLEGFNERLGELYYILTGRYEFSPESRNS